MLQAADHARVVFDPDLPDLTGAGWLILEVGEDEDIRVRRSDEIEYRRLLGASSWSPQHIGRVGESALWMYRGLLLWDDCELDQEEVRQAITARMPARDRRSVPRTTTYSAGPP